MNYDPDIHHRRTVRLMGHDYSAIGVYFVTICVQGWECLLGEIVNGAMVLNEAGRMVEGVWHALPSRYHTVEIDSHAVMPNHFHGIIRIHDVGAPLAAPQVLPNDPVMTGNRGDMKQGAASGAPALGMIVRAFKSISAIAVNRLLDRAGQPVWQGNYYERVLRDDDELSRTRQYILDNPVQWPLDAENPANVP